jgi:benzoylformate decarboxylase/acetolactate synthase-1/2/3 large subunit
MGADPAALEEAAELLVGARRPIIVAGYAGRDPRAFDWIPQLAEALGAGIIDMHARLNAPTTHPLNVTGTEAIGDADVILMLDMKDTSKALVEVESATRVTSSKLAEGARIIDVGFNDHQASAWIHDIGPLHPIDLAITADTSVALPLLLELVTERLAAEPDARRDERAARRQAVNAQHAERRAAWRAVAERRWDERPVSPARLAARRSATPIGS